jgi:putative membrane protein
MWFWGSGAAWWGWLLGCIGMLVFWGVVICAIWYVVTHAVSSAEPARRDGAAERILDERLARGEIDSGEYVRLRDTIRGEQTYTGNGRTPVSSGGRQ